MSKWHYDPDDEDHEQRFERFRNKGSKKPEEYVHEDNKKANKPPRRNNEIRDDDEC